MGAGWGGDGPLARRASCPSPVLWNGRGRGPIAIAMGRVRVWQDRAWITLTPRRRFASASPLPLQSAGEGDSLPVRIGRAVLVHEAAIGIRALHVDVRAGGEVLGLARADLEIDGHLARAVDHVMAVAAALREGRAIAGAQDRLAAILDQHQLTFQHIDELVLMGMPMPLARPVARRQA